MRIQSLTETETPILDVRSPSEFAHGSIPGAKNLPLLDDAEREQVGTVYKQMSSAEALQLGIQLFAAKAPAFQALGEELIGAGRTVTVHCARGGQRSGFVGAWLRSQGYAVSVLPGGYKRYRQGVIGRLGELARRQLLVLDGRTGSGKTDILRVLIGQVPCLDFEGYAEHRGSAFGDFALPGAVATQQNFENRLDAAYVKLPPAGEILVEIETMLGPISLPKPLRDRLEASDVVLLTRTFEDRVERLAAEYTRGWTAAMDELFVRRLELLRRHLSKDESATLVAAVRRRDFRSAVVLLLDRRYDKVYDKGISRRRGRVVMELDLTHDEPGALAWLRERFRSRAQTT